MKFNKRSCKGCPINITTEEGDYANAIGCLPSYADVMKWYLDTGKVWACHEVPTSPCKGLLIINKQRNIPMSVNQNTILITDTQTLDEIYKTN